MRISSCKVTVEVVQMYSSEYQDNAVEYGRERRPTAHFAHLGLFAGTVSIAVGYAILRDEH